MNNLIQICLDVLSTAESKDLYYDWDDSEYNIKFERNGNRYRLKFTRRFFGIISDIYLIDDYEIISDESLTKQEFKILEKAYLDREDELRDIKFKKAFPNIKRDSKINQLIND